MAEFSDDTFLLFGDNASDPCAAVEIAMIQDVYADYGRTLLEKVLARITDVVMEYTQIPEDRIFVFYRNSQLWSYQKKDVLGNLMSWGFHK